MRGKGFFMVNVAYIVALWSGKYKLLTLPPILTLAFIFTIKC